MKSFSDDSLPLSFTRRLLLSTAAVLGVIQFLSAFVLIWERIFPPRSGLTGIVFAEWQYLLKPEWDMVYYRIFVALSLTVGTLCVIKFRKQSHSWDAGVLRPFVVTEAVLTALILDALFKRTVYAEAPQLSSMCYNVLIVIALLNKFFFLRILEQGRLMWRIATAADNAPLLRRIFEIGFLIFLVSVIYLPDPEAVVARIFMGDHLQHFDSAIMAPGLASASGHKLNIDQISQYGVGLPIVIAWITKAWGGLTYQHALEVIVFLTLVYFIAWYVLLRGWLQSAVLAAAAILYGVRVQMFHTGVYPILFTYPSATVVRYGLDIVLMIMLFLHLRKPRRIYLAGAALVCAASLFLLTSEGVYQTAAFYAYLLLHAVIPSQRQAMMAGAQDKVLFPFYFLITPAAMILFFYLVQGPQLWSSQFFRNMGEFINYFLSGFGMTPLDQSLRQRNFLSSLIGFVIPAAYVLSITILGALVWLKNAPRMYLFPVVLGLYGLAEYTYYIARSAETSYYAVSLPFVFLMFFWLGCLFKTAPSSARMKGRLLVFLLSVFALMTNHNFIAYPNVLNWSRNPIIDPMVAKKLPDGRPYFNHLYGYYPAEFKLPVNNLGNAEDALAREDNFVNEGDLKQYFRAQFDFSEDAGLIDRLTKSGEPVALVSSFEVEILRQAKRAPFFYYFPLVLSRPLTMRIFPFTSLYTQEHLKKTIAQLEAQKPEYIFMERILLNTTFPESYQYHVAATVALEKYVMSHYEPYETGRYLAAMKRKSGLDNK